MSANVTTRDEEFFNAVYSLMTKSFPDMIERFGIWRIHEHFQIDADETFHEISNHETKESTLRIVKKEELPESAVATSWRLSADGHAVATWCCDGPILK